MDNLDMKTLEVEFDALDETVRRQFRGFEDFVSFKQVGGGEFVDPACCFSGGTVDVGVETAAEFDEATATDDLLKEHFAKTKQVQDEFHDEMSYLAYIRHHRQRAEVVKVDGGATGNFDEASATNEQLEANFAQSQQLQDEFHDSECYLAFVHHQKKEVERQERRANRLQVKEARGQRIRELIESTV